MPLPTPNPKESPSKFMKRCMGDKTMVAEYPDNKQRTAICIQQSKQKEIGGDLKWINKSKS